MEYNKKEIDELYNKMTWEERILQLASSFPNGVKRLRIGHMQQGECLHGIKVDEATSFPQAIAMGCTWNPELIKEVASAIAKESRAVGIHQCHSPMLGVARDIRWGRTEESFGEDPYLVSKIGVAFIKGLQGEGKEQFGEDKIISCAKHFVADAEPLSGNNGASVDISERLLHEVHLVPFKAAVEEAHVGSIMPAHHALNGVPCHMNKYIMNTVLRDMYGFDGVTISDNGDIRCLSTVMGVAKDLDDAAVKALEAGVDTELAWLCPMGKNRAYGPGLLKMCKEGKIDTKLIETSVKRVLKMKQKMGLLNCDDLGDENNFFKFQGDSTGDKHIHYADTMRSFGVKKNNYKEILYDEKTNNLAKECAVQAITLLKNQNNLLPLNKNKIKKIAVIGPNIQTRLLGGYSTPNPRYFVSVLDGIKKAVGNNVTVMSATGCNPNGFESENIEEAEKIAKECDVVILAVGGNELTCRENQDVDTLNFAGDQEELIQRVYKANDKIVMLLLHGRPNAIEWESHNIPSILECFYLGQETGNALADIIFGKRNPGGKLTLTIPRNVGQCPAFYNKYPFGRAQNYYNSSFEPLYPFGFGLSYTKFKISLPVVKKSVFSLNEENNIEVTVKNIGSCEGDEVIQLYVHDVIASLVRPSKELKAFKRITLKPGESSKVIFSMREDMFHLWKNGRFIVEPGEFEMMVGTNSVDTQSVFVTIKE